MKKLILLLAAITVVVAACKKDRVCSCKTITEVKANNTNLSTTSVDQDYTLKDVSYRNAYNYCTHMKISDTAFGTTILIDRNCSLK